LGEKLENSSCQAVGSDVRVRINETGNYCYPDVTVICGTPIFDPPDRQMNVTNPKAVIEVTSPSSEADDHGEKVDDYRLIDSLQEYFIVSQDRIRIETYYRQSDSIWAIGPALTDLNRSVKFRSLDIEVPLSEIYAGIEFSPQSPKPESN
jgi:Uma2 family endonuclease